MVIGAVSPTDLESDPPPGTVLLKRKLVKHTFVLEKGVLKLYDKSKTTLQR